MSDPEKQRVLVEWNSTRRELDPRLVHELFESQARTTPEATAVEFGGTHLTYQELDVVTNQLAGELARRGIRPGDIVAVCMERSLEMVIALMAILKAGAAYAPLDPSHPPARLDVIARDVGAPLVLVDSGSAGLLPGLLTLPVELERIRELPVERPSVRVRDDELAYVIYTSGSTGTPKGVMNVHHGLRNVLGWMQAEYRLGPGDAVLQKTPYTFDVSIGEIFWPLMVGARIVVAKPEGQKDVAYLVDTMRERNVSTVDFVPSLFGAWLESHDGGPMPALRRVLCAGEALPRPMQDRFFERIGDSELHNLYGPTEAAVYASSWTCRPTDPPGSVPIGGPIANTQLYVVDEDGAPCAVGIPGELCIAGSGLARGYWKRPALTAEKFVPNPFSAEPGARMYRTGDLARFRADGALEYLGRLDHQVKVRGFRIELGEIEAALAARTDVSAAVVVAREHTPGDKRLVAYVVAAPGTSIDVASMKSELARSLPEYMVPSAFVVLDALPLTASGKVDRKALPAPDFKSTAVYARARNPVEEQLCGIFEELLGVSPVGIDDDFFELGGHSLVAASLASRAHRRFHVRLDVRTIFETRTVRAIAQRIGERTAHDAFGEIAPAEAEARHRLSNEEARLWFLHRLDPHAATYNECAAWCVDGVLEPDALVRAFARLQERHEALRTRFVERDGLPVRVVDPPSGTPPVQCTTARDEAEAALEIRRRAREPYDLSNEHAWRAMVVDLGAKRWAIALVMHHIVTDDWSLHVLFRDLSELYLAETGGGHGLAEKSIDYGDWVAWRERASATEIDDHVEHFVRRLAGSEPAELPTDRPRSSKPRFEGDKTKLTLERELRDEVESLARRAGATAPAVLLATLAAFVHRHIGSSRFAIGMPVANRNREEIESLVGFFVNTVAIDFDFRDRPTMRALLGRTREAILDAHSHGEAPLDLVVDAVRRRTGKQGPLLQIVFAPQPPDAELRRFGAFSARSLDVHLGTSKFDLTLYTRQREAEIALELEYDSDLFDRATIERFTEHFRIFLAAAVASPDERISSLPLMSEAEKRRVVVDWNTTDRALPEPARIDALFREQAARNRDRVALVMDGRRMTYGELDGQSSSLARRLRALGVGPEVMVGISTTRSFDLVVGLIAILKAGGAYVPLDPTYPEQRIALLVEDAGVRLALDPDAEIVLPDSVTRIVHDRSSFREDRAISRGSPESAAYVLFTSGSTGKPKGVCVDHRAVVRLVRETDYGDFRRDDAFLMYAPLAFDASTLEIWGALLNGARLVIAPPGVLDVDELGKVISAEGVTVLWLTSALFQQFVDHNAAAVSRVRQLFTGGDVTSVVHADRLLRAAPNVRLVNGYGPTENTTFTTCHPILKTTPGSAIPIGKPIANSTTYILGDDMSPTPVGVAGELYTGGLGVARGYIARPALTAEKFVPDPFSRRRGARMYRTGDLARWRADGTIEFLGRIDQQVKIRGFRIELGEIESVLSGHATVRDAVVVARQDRAGEKRLVAYVVARAGFDLDVGRLRDDIKKTLPEHMVPSAFIVLDALPQTPSGKVDRKALPAPDLTMVAAEYVAPRDPIEEALAGIFSEVLDVPRVGIHDDFFALGGHSLRATRVVSRMRSVFGLALPVRALFETPTVSGLAQSMRASSSDGTSALPPLARVGRSEPLRASFAQTRLWFLDQLEGPSPTYNVPSVVRMEGVVDANVLGRAVHELVARHEMLRTTFVAIDGEPHQIIHAETRVPLGRIDARSEEEAGAIVTREVHAPFDLAKGPVVRATLVRVRDDVHVFVMCIHHIATDGWSNEVLMRELVALYGAFRKAEPSPLAAHAFDYADYAVWQRTWLVGDVLAKQLAFWKEHLAGAPAALELPTDRPRPAVKQYGGETITFELDAALADRVRAFCRREGATPFMVLLTAFQSVLSRWSGQKDIVVGTPIANRTHHELEGMVGFFVNTLALRARFDAHASFADVLRQTKLAALAAYSHQDVPFEKLVEELGVARDMSRTPIFQAMFVMENMASASKLDALDGLALHEDKSRLDVAKFDLTLAFAERAGGLQGSLEYDTALFDQTTIERFAEHYNTHLAAAVAAPGERVASLPLMDDAEKQRVLVEWNSTRAEYASDKCIHEVFEAQVARTPNAIAVEYEDERISYAELNARANRLASWLREQGVGLESPVGVLMDRSVEMVTSLYGVLKAGAAYVPLDPELPVARLETMIARAGARCILGQRNTRGLLRERVVDVVSLLGELSARPAHDQPSGARGASRAYIIYTSGSTGTPKGVVNTHEGIRNRLLWMQEAFRLTSDDCVLQKTPFTFDVSVWELFWPLMYGARLAVARPGEHRDPRALVDAIRKHGVTTLHFVPSMLTAFLEEDESSSCRSVRQVFCSGEALTSEQCRRFRERLRAELHNLYGPTEAAVDVTWWDCSRGSIPERVPIGRPIANTQCFVLDEWMNPVPIGVPGELHLGGIQLARGYVGRPDLTAERFVPSPFADGQRLYKTGDLARFRADGALEYLGRIDHQVKVRGFRIELGEIEATLASRADVSAAAVVAREDSPGDKRLVGYVVGAPGARIDVATVKTELGRSLPDYMVPGVVVVLDALPLTPSGKVDRKALPAPDLSVGAAEYVAPRSPLEASLAQVWRDVLKVERVGIHDDFFALGGHSLLATQVVSRIRSLMRFEVPVRALFEAPTIAELAKRLEPERAEESASPPLVRRQHHAPTAASFAQERLWFLDRLNPGSDAYNVPSVVHLRGALDEASLRRALDELVRRHEVLRTTFAEVDGRPVQVIAPPSAMTFAKDDVSGERDPQARARELVAKEVTRPFDLAKGPLVRAVLVRLAESEHVLLVAMHHVVSDAWSIDVMWREVWDAYAAFAAGRPSPLADLSLQYADYAVWQREWLQGDVLERQISFWKAHLAGAPAAIDLPTDRPRPAVQTFHGGNVPFAIDAETAARVKELCRRLGATPFMLLMSAFGALLSRYSGERDLVIGTPIANRNRAETEGLIGFFVNTLPLRVGLETATTFEELVRATKETALAAYAHQDVPFERVVEALGVPRDLSRTPVFQVMFAMQNVAGDAVRRRVGDLEAKLVPPSVTVAKFDLTLELGEAGSCFDGGLEYNSGLFDRAAVERMAEHFVTLLRAATARPEEQVARLPLMTEAERRQVLVEWNDTAAEYGSDTRLHELFEDQARRTPDAIAVEFEDSRLSYRELDERAERIATWLAARGTGTGRRVAITVPRSENMVAAMLGVLKSGAAYVPIDLRYPEERKQFMRDDAGCVAELTEATMAEALAAAAANEARERVRSGDLAYVLYTSGSTGRPKGVMVEHRNVVNLVRAMLRDPGMAPTDVELALTTLSFDVAGAEIYVPLAAGARIVVASEETARDPKLLSELIARTRANTAGATPATWRMLVADGWRPGPDMHIHTAGEALPRDLADALLERGAKLYNLYGPTETAIYATGIRVEAGDAITIGRPIVNTATYVLDENMEPVPTGLVGELYIAGANVARGYNGRPELTAQKFVPDPFSSKPGARMYATGDLARWRANGTLDYLGRNDHQVKVRGFRIELGEIEAALASRPDVRAAVVLAREDIPGDKRLVGYVVAAAAANLDVATLRTELGRKLPDYMVPSAFVVLDALPLTPSGKVDRTALPAPDFSAPREAYVAPRSPLEESLAHVWCEVLKQERAGVHDDFFALGGHSLLATQVVSRIRSMLGVELPVRALFEAPTIAALAKRLEQERAQESATPPLVKRNHDGPPAASFAQERLWFLDRLIPGSHAYDLPTALRLHGRLDEPALRRALDELVRRHETLRTTFAEHDGRPVQVIAPPSGMPFAKHDVSTESDPNGRALSVVAEEIDRPFDLAQGPLVRAVLVRVAESDHVLLVAMHHVVSDAWSLDVMWRELWTAYAAFASGRGSPLADLSLQYADYAVWQREWLQGEALERQVAFWKAHLAGAPAALDLPTDRPRPPVQTFRGGYVRFAIDAETAARSKELCRRLGATPFMVLLSAFAALLSRYSGQRDLVIGTPIANRNRAETESLIGFFVNTLPLRVGIDPKASFEGLVRATKETALAAYAHQDVPFERVVDQLGVPRDLSRTPVFQVMFSMEHGSDAQRRRVGDLETEPFALSDGAVAKFDLMLFLRETSFDGGLEYNSDLFDRATIERMAEHFVALLRAAVAHPDERLERLAPRAAPRPPPATLFSELERRTAQGPRMRRSSAVRVDADRLSAFARRIDVDPAAVLLAVFLGYAARSARAEEIAVAYQGSQVGATWVPLAIDTNKEESFASFARRLSHEMRRLEARSDHPADVTQSMPRWLQTAGVVLGGATDGGAEGPPLILRIDRGGSAAIDFDSGHFDAPLAELLVERLSARLADAMLRPEATQGDLVLLTEDEHRKVLFDWNATEAPTPRGLMHELFVARAARSPDAIAVLETGRPALTYGELDRRSNAVARWLRARGLRRGGHVGVWIERSSELVVAMLGVLKAGGIYVPLERRWPGRRIASIANGLSMRFLVTKAANETVVSELTPSAPTLRDVLYVDRDLGATDDDRPLPTVVSETDLAYIIYTSGSTGEPKGVVETHRAAVNLITWVNQTFDVGPQDRLLFVTSPCFDLSIYDVFGTLAAGGSIRVASEDEVAEPTTLLRIMRDDAITFWDSAPAVLLQLATFFEKKADATLRIVFLSGDWVPVSLPDRVRDAFPRARVIALGGATEATVWSNFFPVGEVDLSSRSIPYGRPITNAQYYVLDDALEPCPVGLPGDLYIGGECLALGYTDPILTAGKFVPDPYRGVPGARLYRTGDRARFLADGNIEFLGRLDNQVKVRGYRIELGEIEAAMRAHPSVREAFGHVRERGSRDDKELIAYVVPRAGEAVDAAELRKLAKDRLPEYMVPSAFVVLETLPLTPNGKVDRKALPAPDLSAAVAEYVAPRDEMEQMLADIFCEVLGVPRVGIHDDFFALGGHSLLATRVVSRIGAQLDVEIRVRALFEAATVALLAERVRAASGRAHERPLLVRAPERLAPALSFVQEVLAAWETRRSPSDTWNGAMRIDLRGPLDAATLRDAVAATVTEHDVLRWAYDARAGLKVLPASAIPFEELDATASSDLDVDGLCSARATTPFTFDGSPLTRFLLLRRSSTEHVLLLGYHAFVNALSRKQVIADHLLRQWRSIVEKRPAPEPTPVRFTDYVAWERAWYGGGGREEVAAAKKSLEGARPLEIADYPRKGPVSPAAIDDFVVLDVADSAHVHDLARALMVSPFTIFVATAATLLSRWSASDDITLLAPVDLTHRHDALRQVVGTFHNWQALRVSCAGKPTFAELVARARAAVNEARDFDAVPAPLVFDSPNVFDHPLNRVLLSTPAGGHSGSPVLGQVGEVTATEGELGRLKSGARNDLGIGMWSAEGRVYVVLRGAKDLFRPETIAARRAELCAMLHALSPDKPIAKL